MALLACNLTAAAVTLAAGKRSVVLPAAVAPLTYGAPVNVTSELAGLTDPQYALIEAQRGAGSIALFWDDGIPLFPVATLTVGTNVSGVTVQNTAATVTAFVESRQAVFTAPDAADLISIVAAVLPADGAQIIAAQPDYPRKLQVRIVTGSTAGTLTLVGVGVDGQAVTQAIDISTAGGTRTTVTTHAFATLTSATVSAINTPAGTIGIGVGAALGLPSQQAGIVTAFGVFKATVDGGNEAVGTVDATARTIEPTTAPNATHNYVFNYKFTVTPVSPAHNHALA